MFLRDMNNETSYEIKSRDTFFDSPVILVPGVMKGIDIINDSRTWMKDIKHFFIMVPKDVLKDVHKIIMKDLVMKNNLTPHEWGAEELRVPKALF